VKIKKNYLFLFLVILLFSGCTSSAKNKNKAFINIPDINNYDAIFIGENHTHSENFHVQIRLMKHYYAQGVRDFAFEAGYADTLFFQHYIDTGDEECLEFLFRANMGTFGCSREAFDFYRELYKWNSGLGEKIKFHGFDVEQKPVTGIAAIWFFVLRNYEQYKNIPLATSQDRLNFIQNYNYNTHRYSELDAKDKYLLERIMMGIGQAVQVYLNNYYNEALRAQYMTDNFSEILSENKDRKIFAIMGSWHAASTGFVRNTPSMANALKDEIRIASVSIGQTGYKEIWPYIIPINTKRKVTPFTSAYKGNWPYY